MALSDIFYGYDPTRNDAELTGQQTIYTVTSGVTVPQGGIQVNIDESQRNILPNILTQIGNSMPVWVWVLIVGLLGFYMIFLRK